MGTGRAGLVLALSLQAAGEHFRQDNEDGDAVFVFQNDVAGYAVIQSLAHQDQAAWPSRLEAIRPQTRVTMVGA
jgi:hypothetical protein